MKQFRKILCFELQNYLKNKIFVGVTLFLVLLIAVLMFFPRLTQKADEENGATGKNPGISDRTSGEIEDLPTLLLGFSESLSGQKETITAGLSVGAARYRVNAVKETGEGGESKVKSEIRAENADYGFFLRDLTSYTCYVNNLSLYDEIPAVAEGLLQNLYRLSALTESGVSPETAQSILSTGVEGEVEILGKDQMKNFFYTYIMVFALYMVILLYGQMVATNVASEKSSRAMELLITSANPVSMMFGKVISSCLAGVLQLTAVFGSAFLFFNLNRSYFDENGIIGFPIFDMPLSLLLYMVTFFILGFFIYAFLFGAVGLHRFKAGGYQHGGHAADNAVYHFLHGRGLFPQQRLCGQSAHANMLLYSLHLLYGNVHTDCHEHGAAIRDRAVGRDSPRVGRRRGNSFGEDLSGGRAALRKKAFSPADPAIHPEGVSLLTDSDFSAVRPFFRMTGFVFLPPAIKAFKKIFYLFLT